MNERKDIITVTALNLYIAHRFENDRNLICQYVKGEVSNVRTSGNFVYFVLKDDQSEITALMYASYLRDYQLVDGMKVIVKGKISVYQRRGTYSIKVSEIENIGLGKAHLKFIELQQKLRDEGLFEESHKAKIPSFPEKIGLITSKTGDAKHDVISTIENRYPISKVFLYPAIVQGDKAAKTIIKAINKANLDNICDVLIVCRGGGSIEDLSCFNDEDLARCIYYSTIPVVSGVGHESDFTISDFVSDLRAPTPTGAAALITPDRKELKESIIKKQQRLVNILTKKMTDSFNDYKRLSSSYVLTNFEKVLDEKKVLINGLKDKLNLLSPSKKVDDLIIKNKDMMRKIQRIYNSTVSKKDISLQGNIDKLIILNPLNIMSKGYTVSFQDEHVVTSINNIDKSKTLKTRFIDGEVESKIIKIERK